MPLEYVPLQTFADAIAYLIDSGSATNTADERRKARRCVLDCYREFPQRDSWLYFTRKGEVRTSASQDDGSISYDHSGGAYERLVTLTGATLPDEASWFRLRVGTVEYEIERVISSTQFTLPEFNNPGEDLSAGTAYSLYRTCYPVPIDWRKGTSPVGIGDWLTPTYVTPAELMEAKRLNYSPQGWQRWYTIRGGGEQYSGMVFEFQPPPNEAHNWQYLYQADPRPLGMIGADVEYTTGTVAVSGTTVTGTTTAWTSRMVGCVIRFTTSGSVAPTGVNGVYGVDNPYTEQRIVTNVASATSLTIDQALDGTYSATKHSIGDPIDLDYHVMIDAFLAMCAWKWSVLMKYDQEIVAAKEAAWIRAFRQARAADFRTPDTQQPIPTPLYARLLT